MELNPGLALTLAGVLSNSLLLSLPNLGVAPMLTLLLTILLLCIDLLAQDPRCACCVLCRVG